MTVSFILNNRNVVSELPSGAILLDYIRYHQHAMGTKIGCREGDCGACTVLIGEMRDGQLVYRSMTSCLTPMINVHGKHVVTIEGLNLSGLSPVQQAVVDEGGTQCGFCTVGFVVSLTGFCMDDRKPDLAGAVAAMNGNICRCTGYKSLERAADIIVRGLENRDGGRPIRWLVDQGYLPEYFVDIPKRLADLPPAPRAPEHAVPVGGGTDLYVQRPEDMEITTPRMMFGQQDLTGIREQDDRVVIGAAATAEDLHLSPIMNRVFPRMPEHMKLVSSTQIRNMGTLAGNLVNASPIGDLSIFFLALDSRVHLEGGPEGPRTVELNQFFRSYKVLDKLPEEVIAAVSFPKPPSSGCFNFEKVSKRTHLDIASVNAAALLEVEDTRIVKARLSAGGVKEIPLFLAETSQWLEGKSISETVVREAAQRAASEIAPISDVRGSAGYKRLLLRQMVFAHFLTLFPEELTLEALV